MKILNIVTVLIKNKDEILLLYRNKLPYKGYFAFPGGKLEFGEDLKEAAIREIEEETSIYLNEKELSLYAVLNETLKNENGELEAHFLLSYFIAETDKIEVPKDTREGKLAWYNIKELPEPIIPSDRKILESYLQNVNEWDNQYIRIIEGEIDYTKKNNHISLELKRWKPVNE